MNNDKQAKLIKLEHGGHSMINESARQSILNELESFLREHIGDR